MREGTRNLIGARQSDPGNAVGRPPFDRLTVEDDTPGVRAVISAHDVDQRRLPGAIGSEQTQNLSAIDVESHAVESLDAGEGFAHLPQRQHPGTGGG